MQVCLTPLTSGAPDALPFEIVERKGLGHPDTLCDSLAETLSLGLSRFYLERFGRVLHHNVDKALLLGGAARPASAVAKSSSRSRLCLPVGRPGASALW